MVNLGVLGSEVTKMVIKKSPGILAGLGIGCFIFSTVAAVKATPKAMKKIEEAKAKDPIDKVRAGWRYYVIPGIGIILGTTCVVASVLVSNKRCAQLATACLGYEQLLSKQYEKTEEIVGKKKAEEIRDAVDIERMREVPFSSVGVYDTGYGHVLFYDSVSKRYFRSNIHKVQKAVEDLNVQLSDETKVTYSDLCNKWNIPASTLTDGAIWDTVQGDYPVRLRMPCDELPTKITEDGSEPCFVLSFSHGPRCVYRDLYT